MSQTKNILIFGGTGVIGKYITSAILASKESFDKVALFTSASTVSNKKEQLEEWKHQGLDIIVGDLNKDDDVLSAYKNFDTVVSAVGRNVIAEQINLIKLAEATPNITRFFPSEYGTDIEYNPQTSPHEKPHQLKLKVRKYIREEVRRLDVTYLVTGPYADLYLGKSNNAECGSFDTKAKKATLLGSGEDPVSFTTMKDVGKLLVAALKHPEEGKNKALKVNSFTTTPNEILAEFEKQTGEQKWDVEYTSLAKLTELEKKAWEEGNPAATVYTLRRIWTEGGTLYEKRDNALIDAEETDSLAQAIAQVVDSQV